MKLAKIEVNCFFVCLFCWFVLFLKDYLFIIFIGKQGFLICVFFQCREKECCHEHVMFQTTQYKNGKSCLSGISHSADCLSLQAALYVKHNMVSITH